MRSPRHILGSALGLAIALATSRANAQSEANLPSPLTASAVVEYARAHRSEILAANARAAAAAQQPAIVSALNDPMLMTSIDHLPFMFDGVNASVMYQQEFPLSGVLRDRRRVAEAAARRTVIDVRRAALDVELEAAEAYWMLVERRRVVDIVTEQLELARQLVAASTARYAAAQTAQSEVLRAQTDVATLTAELDAARAEVAGAEAMLNASLARVPTASIPAADPHTAFAEPPPLAMVLQRADTRRPEIESMRAEVVRARAEVRVMQSMYWPMAFVRTGAAYTMQDGPGLMAMFGVSLPVWRGRLRAGVVESEQMVNMANAEVTAMRQMIAGEAARARANVMAVRARAIVLRDQTIPLAEQGFTASLATYVAGQSPLVSVIDSRRVLAEARMSLVMNTIAYEIAFARLDRAMGTSPAVGADR